MGIVDIPSDLSELDAVGTLTRASERFHACSIFLSPEGKYLGIAPHKECTTSLGNAKQE
jgi:hypothetical protein